MNSLSVYAIIVYLLHAIIHKDFSMSMRMIVFQSKCNAIIQRDLIVSVRIASSCPLRERGGEANTATPVSVFQGPPPHNVLSGIHKWGPMVV